MSNIQQHLNRAILHIGRSQLFNWNSPTTQAWPYFSIFDFVTVVNFAYQVCIFLSMLISEILKKWNWISKLAKYLKSKYLANSTKIALLQSSKIHYNNSIFSCFRQSQMYDMGPSKSYLSCFISWSCSSCHLYLCIMLHCLSKWDNKIFIPKQDFYQLPSYLRFPNIILIIMIHIS